MRIYSDKNTFYSHEYSLEKDFERELIEHSNELFPSCFYLRWDPLLVDVVSGEGVKPDGIIINHDFSKWGVVEVELARNHKKPHIIDQLGRLSRVDYTKCKKSINSALEELGIEEPTKVSKNLVAETPELVLIIDKHDENLTQIARDRNFSTLVVHPFWSSCGMVQMVIENNLSFTLEQNTDAGYVQEIVSTKESRKKITNGVWWYKLDQKNNFVNIDKINVVDSEGSFPVLIEDIGGDLHLRLPKDRKTVMDILKSNKIGKLEISNESSDYILKNVWRDI